MPLQTRTGRVIKIDRALSATKIDDEFLTSDDGSLRAKPPLFPEPPISKGESSVAPLRVCVKQIAPSGQNDALGESSLPFRKINTTLRLNFKRQIYQPPAYRSYRRGDTRPWSTYIRKPWMDYVYIYRANPTSVHIVYLYQVYRVRGNHPLSPPFFRPTVLRSPRAGGLKPRSTIMRICVRLRGYTILHVASEMQTFGRVRKGGKWNDVRSE